MRTWALGGKPLPRPVVWVGETEGLEVTEPSEKIPGPWELYRGIERIEQTLKDQAANYVTQHAFALEKQILVSMINGLGTEVAEQKSETKLNKERADAADKAREDAKARTRLMWVSIFASPFVGVLVGWALSGALRVPSGG